jgi:hypothetical protein
MQPGKSAWLPTERDTIAVTDTATTIPDVPAPPVVTHVHDWPHRSDALPICVFDGTTRQAAGFTIRIGGQQRSNGTRWVAVEAVQPVSALLEPEAVRELAAALVVAADEIEARR